MVGVVSLVSLFFGMVYNITTVCVITLDVDLAIFCTQIVMEGGNKVFQHDSQNLTFVIVIERE